jgi:hypothetical protein
MTFDFFYFDEDNFRQEIQDQEAYPLDVLQSHIYEMRAQISVSAFGWITSAWSIIPTAGLSVVPGAISARFLVVANQKLQILEGELSRRGQASPPGRTRDMVIPLVVGSMTMGMGSGLAATSGLTTRVVAGSHMLIQGTGYVAQRTIGAATGALTGR